MYLFIYLNCEIQTKSTNFSIRAKEPTVHVAHIEVLKTRSWVT